MDRYKKLASDTVILGLGTFGSKLLVFLLMPLYTAWLSTAEYGTAELITGTANLLIPLACVGITNGIFRFAAERGGDREEVFSSSIALLLAGSAVFLALSPLLSLIDYFDTYLYLIILYVVSANLQAVCAQYVRALDRPRLFAVQGILNTALTVGCNILLLAVWELGVTGYVLSVIIGNLLTTLFLVVTARLWRAFHVRKISRRCLRELLFYSLPMIPTTVCWLITDLSDRYMVTYWCGEAVNGVYAAAYKIPTIINLLSGIFMQAWQFSAVAASSSEEECVDFYSRVWRGFLSVIFIGAGFLVLSSGVMTVILLNAAYRDAWRYMPTLIASVAIEALVSFLATVYMVRKKTLHSFLTAMLGAVGNVILNLILIPRIGALGAAIATLASYALVFAVRLPDATRIIRFRIEARRLFANLVLLLAAAFLMTFGGSLRALWALLPVLVLIILNAPALLQTLKHILRRR